MPQKEQLELISQIKAIHQIRILKRIHLAYCACFFVFGLLTMLLSNSRSWSAFLLWIASGIITGGICRFLYAKNKDNLQLASQKLEYCYQTNDLLPTLLEIHKSTGAVFESLVEQGQKLLSELAAKEKPITKITLVIIYLLTLLPAILFVPLPDSKETVSPVSLPDEKPAPRSAPSPKQNSSNEQKGEGKSNKQKLENLPAKQQFQPPKPEKIQDENLKKPSQNLDFKNISAETVTDNRDLKQAEQFNKEGQLEAIRSTQNLPASYREKLLKLYQAQETFQEKSWTSKNENLQKN
jgi:hypothetical protein